MSARRELTVNVGPACDIMMRAISSTKSSKNELPHGLAIDRGQTREICKKQEQHFKGKVVTFTIQSLILYQYPVDLLTFFELY